MKYILAGVLGGIIGGMGMGGGTLLIPILTIMLEVPQREAQLINVIAFIPMAIASIIVNAKTGLMKWRYILYVGISSCISALIGSYISGRLEGKVLSIIFGTFLVLVGVVSIVVSLVKYLLRRRRETLTSVNIKKSKD